MMLAFLAEAHGKAGQAEEGLALLDEAQGLVAKTGERTAEAEVHRVKGELLLARSPSDPTQAEVSFREALEVARRQSAKSFELRAATSLARLWQRQGKRDEARDLLAPVYAWFTEGFDTKDLRDAKALLEELA
jgi:predicted ATPase